MEQKAFPLQNRGMNRDASISKAENSTAYENYNIRITARDHDTLLSVTNERGNKEIYLHGATIQGELIGWNVLNNHIILFTTSTETEEAVTTVNYIASFFEGLRNSPHSFGLTFTFKNATATTVNINSDGIFQWNEIAAAFNTEFNNRSIPAVATMQSGLVDGVATRFLTVMFSREIDGDVSLLEIYGVGAELRRVTFTTTPMEIMTQKNAVSIAPPDHIYRIDVDEEEGYILRYGNTDSGAEDGVEGSAIFNGNLGFSQTNPIESIVYYESEDIQKIYWVDGRNVLRFMNFMESADKVENDWDNTYFDSNRIASSDVGVLIKKDNTGNNRANGVVQYLLTYYNEHGQQTGYVWVSDLIYLSPIDSGGSPDGFNSNRITLTFTGLDITYDHFRVYSIERSALNGTVTAYLIAENAISDSNVVVDDGAPISTVDASSLLFLGSQPVVAGTMTHKDETLFLGDLKSIGKGQYKAIQDAIREYAFDDGNGNQVSNASGNYYISHLISFEAQSLNLDEDVTQSGIYPYASQLSLTSSEITGFKGGEKYRFALMFKNGNGIYSDSFWIGDKINTVYPASQFSDANLKVNRVVAKCTIPEQILVVARAAGFTHVVLMMAEASYSDRLVQAQGVLNPTVFNVYERYEQRVYSNASWLFRPRFSPFAWKHFSPIENSESPYGEIQCNYWTGDTPTPYWRRYTVSDQSAGINAGDLVDELDGIPDYNVFCVTYWVRRSNTLGIHKYKAGVRLIYVKFLGALTDTIFSNHFSGNNLPDIIKGLDSDGIKSFDDNGTTYECKVTYIERDYGYKGTGDTSRKHSWDCITNYVLNEQRLPSPFTPSWTLFKDTWTDNLPNNKTRYYNLNNSATRYGNLNDALKTNVWVSRNITTASDDNNYLTSYYKKHLMFLDENVVTFNSPEIEQEAVNIDKRELKLRIVGTTKVTGNISDYTVLASPAHLAGKNLLETSFTRQSVTQYPDGLVSWPLYLENDLIPTSDDEISVPDDIEDRTDRHYDWGGGIVQYWLHMWHKSGIIPDFKDDKDETIYSELQKKCFANLRYCWNTQYVDNALTYVPSSIRQFNYTHDQFVSLTVGSDERTYAGNVQQSLALPGSHKYPILTSAQGSLPGNDDAGDVSSQYQKLSSQPVTIAYRSAPHAVLSLGKANGRTVLLPYVFNIDQSDGNDKYDDPVATTTISPGYIPWYSDATNPDVVETSQEQLLNTGLVFGDRFLLVGELYREENVESDYGGTSEAALSQNKFISASTPRNITTSSLGSFVITGDRGDTYFQRWDCIKTLPYTTEALNSVIEILSFPVETHINIDGRYDKQRGISLLASMNTEEFNKINPVYSQSDNFFTAFDQENDADLDSYRSSITWTLQKADAADIDEWTHITLASSLKLDGDKGICRALRRFNNSIFAFQDRGIAEILFNSRTQIPTAEGVPIEIANSGKVDGKRYITNKYGCINKWSIVEGKAGLYFVDNTNKMFGRLDQGISDLSSKLSFNAYFRRHNGMDPWNPKDFNNFVSFYDRVHSDVYLITGEDTGMGAPLIYNEQLDAFTSFMDYWDVPMMVNVQDDFISFRDKKLWHQNAGLYCNFFGNQYDFSVTYRVTPDPYGDKIWTNLEYRADFFSVVDADGSAGISYNADQLIVPNNEDSYMENMTFDWMRVWNEYQTTESLKVTDIAKDQYADVRKKFRIWRMDIPRAITTATNKYGLDRIRNPWVFIRLLKNMHAADANKCLMQLHDVVVKYFE